MSLIDLWATVLFPFKFGIVYLEPEVTVFRQEGGAVEDILTGSDWEPEDMPCQQPWGSQALKRTMLYCLFYRKCAHNLQNEHHAVKKRTWTKQLGP